MTYTFLADGVLEYQMLRREKDGFGLETGLCLNDIFGGSCLKLPEWQFLNLLRHI